MIGVSEDFQLRKALWDDLRGCCERWGRKEAASIEKSVGLEKHVIELENRLMCADFGYTSCPPEGEPSAKRGDRTTCMTRRFDETVAELRPTDVTLLSVVHFHKPEHVVFCGLVDEATQELRAVHAYHTFDSVCSGHCPHARIREGVGRLRESYALPVSGVVWGERSHVLWVLEPWCQTPTPEQRAAPEFGASRADLIARCPMQNNLLQTRLRTELLCHGCICFRQRHLARPSGMFMRAEHAAAYAKAYPVMNTLWCGGGAAFPFERSDESFRQQCAGADPAIADWLVAFMHREAGTPRSVRWGAFYRSVQLFGYWWRTRDAPGLWLTLRSFFHNAAELGARLTETDQCGFRRSASKPYLAAHVRAPGGFVKVLIVFDPESGQFFDHTDPSELFDSPHACLLAQYRKHTKRLTICCVEPLPQDVSMYQNKETRL